MKFSQLVVLVATLSQAFAPVAKAGLYEEYKEKIKAQICANYQNDPQCKSAESIKADQAAAEKLAKENLAKAKAAQEASEKAAAQAAAKAAAAEKMAKEQAEAKKKQEADKVIVKKEDKGVNPETNMKETKVEGVTIKSSAGYEGPKRRYDAKKSAEVFQSYCDWNGDLSTTPTADYSNKNVARAAEILSQINDIDFYFYGGIKRFYSAAAKTGPAQYTENSRLYLTQLCGEFRDRPEMIEDKVRWITRMVRPGATEQKPIDYKRILDNKKTGGTESIWSQMSGYTYDEYLRTSSAMWEARKKLKLDKNDANENMIDEKLGEEAESPVKPTTICETKFIIGEVVINKSVSVPRTIEQLRAYNKAFGKFRQDPTKCDKEDNDYLYNFRGDANFKHYSPESNAMIWHALSIARYCKSPTQATGVDKDITDEDCKDYFTAPFLSRYNAARSGLAAWLIYDDKYTATITDAKIKTMMLPKFDKNVGKLPFSMQLSSGDVVDYHMTLADSTLQFNEITGLDGSKKKDLKGAYDRLKGAVDRHTNWYQSGYLNISEDPKADQKDQAYSPFVASSYEMSKSDTFAGCGYTVPCGPGIEKHKAWMLVFKVHKNNWYNTNSLADKRPVDFDKVWLDETSFGIESLADAERAFDRLGTAIDGEYAEILLLDNLDDSNQPTKINPIK